MNLEQSSQTRPSRKRTTPPETWPKSIELFRCLAAAAKPLTIRELSKRLATPEITIRARLARLEFTKTILSDLETIPSGDGDLRVTRAYYVTDYARQCFLDSEATSRERTVTANNLHGVCSSWVRN